jgi:predicted nucleotidyltransferase
MAGMSDPDTHHRADLDAVVAILREAGAVFAYVHGSVAAGSARPDSDLDIAAHFGGVDPPSWQVAVQGRVDLLVLDHAPLELAGRVALHGELLFEDDPGARVEWEATTRKIYLDEQVRAERATADLVAAVRGDEQSSSSEAVGQPDDDPDG